MLLCDFRIVFSLGGGALMGEGVYSSGVAFSCT